MLEYCTVVWSPSLVRDIDILEKVQRRFTKRLPGLQNLTYHQRLASLNLESLELRRLRSDLIFAYKLVFGLQNVNVSDFFEVRTNTRSRGHPYKLGLTTAESDHALIFSHIELSAYGTHFPRKQLTSHH